MREKNSPCKPVVSCGVVCSIVSIRDGGGLKREEFFAAMYALHGGWSGWTLLGRK